MSTTEDLTKDLSRIMQLAASDPHDIGPLLNYGLDWMLRLAPFDLVAVFLLESDHLVVKAARGPLADARVLRHAISLDKFTSIREALATCGPRLFYEEDHAHGEGDPFDGVLDFPHGHACMVIPLCFGGNAQGIITFDRERCGTYDSQTIQLVEIYAQVLAMAIHQAAQSQLLHQLMRESNERERILREEHQAGDLLSPLQSKNPAVRELGERARQVAPTPTPVLIHGETGTGKEGIAAFIHQWSERRRQPMVKLNCAAIPESLLESELFGVVKGAFTGAVKDRPGRFRMANGGTLFLDEIGELPLPLQAKLLRVIQEGTFEPVGSDRTIKVDVRILAATNVNLQEAIGERRFREDLYYRLNVFPVQLPPLRQRLEDLGPLCDSLLGRLGRRLGKPPLLLSENTLARLRQYSWPGNIRELGNLLERAAILARGSVLTPDLFDLSHSSDAKAGVGESPTPSADASAEAPMISLDEAQKRHIRMVLNRVNGKIYGPGGAAEILGLKPSTLQSRMKKLGLERKVHFEA